MLTVPTAYLLHNAADNSFYLAYLTTRIYKYRCKILFFSCFTNTKTYNDTTNILYNHIKSLKRSEAPAVSAVFKSVQD